MSSINISVNVMQHIISYTSLKIMSAHIYVSSFVMYTYACVCICVCIAYPIGADYKWSRRTTSSYYGYYYYCDEEVYMGPWKACISSCGLDSCDTIRPSDATGEFASLGYVRFAIITVMLLEIFNWFPLLVWYRACLRTQPMYSWISSADAALDRLPKWNELATFKILMGFQTSICKF